MYDLEFYTSVDEINRELSKIEKPHRRKLIHSPSKLSRAYGKVIGRYTENLIIFVLRKLLKGE